MYGKWKRGTSDVQLREEHPCGCDGCTERAEMAQKESTRLVKEIIRYYWVISGFSGKVWCGERHVLGGTLHSKCSSEH